VTALIKELAALLPVDSTTLHRVAHRIAEAVNIPFIDMLDVTPTAITDEAHDSGLAESPRNADSKLGVAINDVVKWGGFWFDRAIGPGALEPADHSVQQTNPLVRA
jgi:hypothetical protein